MALGNGLRRSVARAGVGLHSGCAVRARLCPAEPGAGRRFVRVDLPGRPALLARPGEVRDTELATRLGRGEASVSTVEHLLAALNALGVVDVDVEVDGPELPVLDGSAAGWVEAIDEAGRHPAGPAPEPLRLQRPVELAFGDRRVRATPAEGLELVGHVFFAHSAVGDQRMALQVTEQSFRAELAWARTFGFLHEVEALRAAGRARGGSLDNAVVFGPTGALNPGGLRAPDEPVRHKLLDMVGDLALLGRPLHARVEAWRPGHALTRALVEALLSEGA